MQWKDEVSPWLERAFNILPTVLLSMPSGLSWRLWNTILKYSGSKINACSTSFFLLNCSYMILGTSFWCTDESIMQVMPRGSPVWMELLVPSFGHLHSLNLQLFMQPACCSWITDLFALVTDYMTLEGRDCSFHFFLARCRLVNVCCRMKEEGKEEKHPCLLSAEPIILSKKNIKIVWNVFFFKLSFYCMIYAVFVFDKEILWWFASVYFH